MGADVDAIGDSVRLVDKVVAVTGAGQGLGLSYARAVAAEGASVVANDVDATLVTAAVDSIRARGGAAEAHVGPVGRTETAESLVQTALDRFGRLDAMVTNAGILRDRVLWNMTDQEFDDVVEVHLRGTFTCARSAARYFRDAGHGGRLVLVGSPAGQHGNLGQSNYAACKAGITAMARTWALELARSGVTVNCVVPSAVTDMTKTIPGLAPHIEAWEGDGVALPDWVRKELAIGHVDDVAPLVVFLISDASADVTGQTIGLGGDRLALWSYPEEVATAYRDGGWRVDDIEAEFADRLGSMSQRYGIAFPEATAS